MKHCEKCGLLVFNSHECFQWDCWQEGDERGEGSQVWAAYPEEAAQKYAEWIDDDGSLVDNYGVFFVARVGFSEVHRLRVTAAAEVTYSAELLKEGEGNE